MPSMASALLTDTTAAADGDSLVCFFREKRKKEVEKKEYANGRQCCRGVRRHCYR
jgi:hypothetical protein